MALNLDHAHMTYVHYIHTYIHTDIIIIKCNVRCKTNQNVHVQKPKTRPCKNKLKVVSYASYACINKYVVYMCTCVCTFMYTSVCIITLNALIDIKIVRRYMYVCMYAYLFIYYIFIFIFI